jgi:hypothetical protein
MANRTVIVDNNTWNNTHIATVGRAMSSNETAAYEIMRKLDVDYVLVIFGGVSGYSSDDINKFLWMVRIGGGVYKDHVQEKDFLSEAVSCACYVVMSSGCTWLPVCSSPVDGVHWRRRLQGPGAREGLPV